MEDSEPSPRSRVEASASLTSSLRAASLRPRPIIRRYDQLDDTEIVEGESCWRPGEVAPGAHPEDAPDIHPQGVAESTYNARSAFTRVPSSTRRELFAAAPSASAGSSRSLRPYTHHPSPLNGLAGPPASGSGASRTNGHVQFSDNIDVAETVPGEVPSTPIRPPTFGDGLGRDLVQQGTSDFAFQASHSPERPPRLQADLDAMRRGLSHRVQPSTRSTSPWALLDQSQDVADLQLELTLQHSNRIEKVSAADLLQFQEGVQPFCYGQHPLQATIRNLFRVPDLNHGCFYIPSDISDAAASGKREVISGRLSWAHRARPVMMQLFVLFPSLMRPPSWLRRDFTQIKAGVVEVDWCLSGRTKFFLNLMRRLNKAERQTLTVWASKRRYGYSAAAANKAGKPAISASFTLYGAEGTAEFTDRSYILVMKFYERQEGPHPANFMSGREGTLSRRNTHIGTGSAEVSALSFLGGAEGVAAGDFLSTSSFIRGPLHRGRMGLDLRQGLQQQLQLRMQSSDLSSQTPSVQTGPLNLESVLEALVQARDSLWLRLVIGHHLMDHLLRSQKNVDKVEKVAMNNNDPILMMLLYDHTPVEMDLRVLAFLVHCWASQPLTSRGAAGGSASDNAAFAADEDTELEVYGAESGYSLAVKIEEFLVKYVMKRRNPLSTTAAILRAIDDEMSKHEENRRVMRLASARLHSLHLALLRRLNRYADARNIRLVERILQPVELPNTVNEVSPLQVAFDSQDLKFMTETLIELYTKVQWRGGELLALTSHEDPRATGATNPLLAYSVLRSLGFAGKGTLDPLVMAASRLWHLYAFTSTAFFNSPRGRWAMHAMCELCFLTLYQWQVMWPDLDPGTLQVLHLVFLCFIVGNLLDMAQFVHYRYGSLARIRKYLIDPWNALSLLVNGGLLVLTCLKLMQDFKAPGLPPYQTADAIHMCMATLAVFVWVRALGMAVPVYPSLGPLLNTVARMMEEVIAFLFPMLIVMTGFSTMMSAVYGDLVDDYGNFASALLQLFSSMLGNFDFTLFDGLPVAQRLYGIIAQVIFLVISAILLMNLLIAIVTNRYRPQEVEAESQFKKAQIVTFYQTQVHRNLVCAPFCLVQVTLQAVNLPPSGRRNKVSSGTSRFLMLGLLPLDGVVLPDDGSDRPTGLAELPHFIYLVTLYPIIMAATWALFLLYTPFGVWQFALKQYAHIDKSYSMHRLNKQKQKQQRQARDRQNSREGANATPGPLANGRTVSTPPRATMPTASPPATPPGPSASSEAASSPAGALADAAAAAAAAAVPATTHGADAGVVRSPSHNLLGNEITKQYQHLKKALQEEAHRSDVNFVRTTLLLVGTMLLAVVGLVIYLLIILLVALVGWSSLYQWLAKILFSLYNILLRPLTDYYKARRRRQRISLHDAPSRSGTGSGLGAPSSAGGRSHIVLDVASGVGVAAAAGGAVPGEHGCAGDTAAAVGGGRGTSLVSWLGAKSGRAGSGGGGQQPRPPLTAEETEAAHGMKARVHWRHAVQKVIAMKNERYLSKADVLKALAKSKFKPHMAEWKLNADLRASSQDILDEQMEDLEDDDDLWDDDVADVGDDDTAEAAILEKTEALMDVLKKGIEAQSKAMDDLNQRVAELARDLALLRHLEPHHQSAGPDSGAGPGSGLGFGEDVDGEPDGVALRSRPSLPRPVTSPPVSNSHVYSSGAALPPQRYISGGGGDREGDGGNSGGGGSRGSGGGAEELIAAALPVLRDHAGTRRTEAEKPEVRSEVVAAAAAVPFEWVSGPVPSSEQPRAEGEGEAGRKGSAGTGAGAEEEGQRGSPRPAPPPPPPPRQMDQSSQRPSRTKAHTAPPQRSEAAGATSPVVAPVSRATTDRPGAKQPAKQTSSRGAPGSEAKGSAPTADGGGSNPSPSLAKGGGESGGGGAAARQLLDSSAPAPAPAPLGAVNPPAPARPVSTSPFAAPQGSSSSGKSPPSTLGSARRTSSAGAGSQSLQPAAGLAMPSTGRAPAGSSMTLPMQLGLRVSEAGAPPGAAGVGSAQSSFGRPVLDPIRSVRHGTDSVRDSLRLQSSSAERSSVGSPSEPPQPQPLQRPGAGAAAAARAVRHANERPGLLPITEERSSAATSAAAAQQQAKDEANVPPADVKP